MDGGMDGWLDGWLGGGRRVDGWMDGWMKTYRKSRAKKELSKWLHTATQAKQATIRKERNISQCEGTQQKGKRVQKQPRPRVWVLLKLK